VLGNAIVDFCAPAASLVVEVDGDDYHSLRSSADAARDRKLVRAGYTVIRIPASLVERDLGAATALVQRALR
jgi:very-short-patch-repair endonuclease